MTELTRRSDNGSTDNVDRIVLRRSENDRLHAWTTALNERFDGMIRVTKSDVANFLIRQRANDLSESEIKLIESELFDEVRWLNWALAKIRQAKKEGQSLSLNELMVKRDAITSRKNVPVKRPKRGRAETVPDSDPEELQHSDLEES